MPTGRLFIVATPIGNLEDLSPRALRVLREVHLIAAEDTRHSRKLLRHCGIDTPLTSYHDHNEALKTETLLHELHAGHDVALITDAGTPCVADPGYRIVSAAHEHGIPVIPIPGPSAPIAALSASGLPTDRVTFHGFFPRKGPQAETLLDALAASPGTHVLLESPQRLLATLDRIAARLPDAPLCVARELTKMFEEIVRGTPGRLHEHFSAGPVRGECVLILHVPQPAPDPDERDPDRLRDLVETAMRDEGLTRRDAVRRVAQRLGLPRNVVYAAAREP